MQNLSKLVRTTFAVILALGLASSALAQSGPLDGPGNCNDWLTWTNNVRGNRGLMPNMRFPPSLRGNVWFCQAKGLNQTEDKFYDYSFYDLSSGIAYDHAQYRCEREQQKCEVRCAYVPFLCIPYTINTPQ